VIKQALVVVSKVAETIPKPPEEKPSNDNTTQPDHNGKHAA
jgi:hypothetical protein